MIYKRTFDFILSSIGLFVFGWFKVVLIIIAYFDCGGGGLFFQKRIGQFGKPFTIYKIRTIHIKSGSISKYAKFLRKYKLDELPQLVNILLGEMSFVGPRPDIPGYYDSLKGDSRKLLLLKPGLCSRAALKYYNEEAILKVQEDALFYNNNVIFPDKVKMNLEYLKNRSSLEDFRILRACACKAVGNIISK